jgi:L-iditol 2-dehydrogenase
MSFPIVLGHEATGVVVETGPGANRLKPGDRVVLRPQETCGGCGPCKQGRYNICENLKVLGCQIDGACADYYAAEESLFYKLPDKLNFEEGTLIEPLSVSVHAVHRAGIDVAGQNVVVMGAGTIGNLAAQAAKGMGAKKVALCDISDTKLNIARQCGLEDIINIKGKDLRAALRDIFAGEDIAAAYECTASESALNSLIGAAPKGIPMVIVGVYGHPVKINMSFVQDREYSLIGTLMYTEKDYLESIRMLEEGKIKPAPLITGRFPLDKIGDAFRHIHNNRETSQKVILTVASDGEGA